MKKIISLLVMSIFLVSCGSGDDEKNDSSADNQIIIDENIDDVPGKVVENTLTDEELDEILDEFFNSVED